MKAQKFLLLIILGVCPLRGNSQSVIKVRSGLNGLETPMWSHRTKEGFSTISNNPYYNVRALKSPYVWIDFHALLEYEHNRKFSIVTGYSNSSLGGGLLYEYFGTADWPETPFIEKGWTGAGSSLILKTVHRVPLYATVKVFDTKQKCSAEEGKHRRLYLQGDLLGGMSTMFFGRGYRQFSPFIFSGSEFENEGHNIVINEYFEYLNKFGFGLIMGANLRLRHGNYDFAGLTFYYEHGLRGMASIIQEGIVDNTFRYQNSVTTLGSQFSLRLTFPVFTYNFTKKKFYRD